MSGSRVGEHEGEAHEQSEFTSDHVEQMRTLLTEARFYADQRFKVVGVFMLTSGLLANVVARIEAYALIGVAGALLSYLCLSWEIRTAQWWAILFERAKALESRGIAKGRMISALNEYPESNRGPFLRASWSVRGVYVLGIVGWFVLGVWGPVR